MMRSAIAFLPPCMMTFMNLASSTLPYLGSGRISRLGTSRRRGMFSPLQLLQLAFPFRGPRGSSDSRLLDPHGQFRASGHYAASSPPGLDSTDKLQTTQAFFGRLAPYLERDCLRSFTPCRSREPRTMW